MTAYTVFLLALAVLAPLPWIALYRLDRRCATARGAGGASGKGKIAGRFPPRWRSRIAGVETPDPHVGAGAAPAPAVPTCRTSRRALLAGMPRDGTPEHEEHIR